MLIELDKNGLEKIKKELLKLSSKSLLVTNIAENQIEDGSKKVSELIHNILQSKGVSPDITSLVPSASYVWDNSNTDLDILVKTDDPPWKYFLTEKLVNKLLSNKNEEAYLDDFITKQFDFYLMIAEIISKRKLSLNDDFIRNIDKGIRSIDNKYDIFCLRNFHTFSFSSRKNNQTSSYLCKVPASTKNYEDQNKRTVILNDLQIRKQNGKLNTDKVLFCYVDLIKIFFIDIEKGIWGAELNLEIISMSDDPINLIRFNNLSVTNSLLKIEKINVSKKENNNYKTYIYNVTANFLLNQVQTIIL